MELRLGKLEWMKSVSCAEVAVRPFGVKTVPSSLASP